MRPAGDRDGFYMNGIIIVDKPAGITSFDVVGRLRRLTGERRVGHAGTLDPMATGVLPLFFGAATKAISLLPCQDKTYIAGLRLGMTTDTGDLTGRVKSRGDFPPRKEPLLRALERFRGPVSQTPPMYSAVHYRGRHLYEYARAGREVPRTARTVQIYGLSLRQAREEAGEYTLEVSCSKGTYIRTLVEDIGAELGCGAVMTSLRRIFAAGFSLEQAHSLPELEKRRAEGGLESCLLSTETPFGAFPAVEVTEKQAVRFCHGGGLALERLREPPEEGLCRLRSGERFLGLGRVDRETRELRVAMLQARPE